ncbi:piezo-type mechanosensitive ion channel component-like isoform X2 [Tachypleus tridentatus]|uniref:piezo-type mechanosensitive ion channel component-like isoform X2 n=1 Tax=Tachypleus tridentatus TaxID=6853 RepID=UPI003FD3D35F
MVVGLHISELIWRFLEIHLIKIVLFSALCLAVYDVCAVHLVFVMFVIVALPFKALQTFLSHCCSVWAAILLLSKMIYQLKFVDQYGWKVNCSDVIGIGQNASEFPYPFNETVDNRVWIGFRKTENLTAYCKGYIGLIVVLTIQAVVKIRQKVHRYHRNDTEPPGGVIFQDINRSHADRGLVECVKFLFNYFFYKFGVEFCFVTTVACIGVRLDVYAVVSAAWLCSLFLLRRRNMARVWPFYVSYQCIILPIQYIMCIGIPPGSCIEYPWSISSNFSEELREWLYLPNFIVPPNSYKILVDFFQLLFACCQLHVFTIETGLYSEMHEGGSNREIWLEQDPSSLPNPVPDFVTYTKSYLDMVKVLVFFSFYWITLAVVFLSGTSRVSLFAMGYVIGCFLFLWNGNEFYLKPMKTLLRMWNGLLAYNVVVILLKAILQVVGCVFLAKLYKNFCWVVQLLGVACIKKLAYHPTSDINKQIPEEDCTVPIDEAGLLWDGICFGFLLLQKRIFYSFYFQHLVREIRAQQMLASRGAELINEIQMKEVQEQQVAEKEIMEKIKTKMDRIRAHQQQTRGKYKEPESHFRAIRSGDYHMFEEFHDEDLDLDLSPKKTEFDEDSGVREKGLNALLSQTLKSNLKYAVEEVKKGSVEDDDIGESSEQSAIISADRSPASRTVSDSSQPQQPSRRVSLSPYDVPGAARRRSSAAVAAPLLSDETGRSYTSTISPAQNGVDTACDDAEETTQESFLQKVKGWMDFGVAFFLSVLISATAKLNTISKDYRFVARQLFREKQILKEQFDSTQPIENLERSDSIKMSYVKDPDVSGPSKETTTISIRLQKGSQDLAESIELVDTPDALEEDFEKSQPTVIRFLVALYYALVSRSELVCYLLIVVNQIKSASLLSLPLPFMAFLWGTLSVPRPSKTFWITIITYTEAIVVVKYLFQFDFFPWNGETHVNAPFWPPRILGIEQKNNYAVYDLALLLIVFFHRFILKSLGLWKDTEKATTLSKDTLDDKTVTSSKETLLEKTESRRGSTDETQKMTDRESSQEKPDRAVETQDEEDDTAVEESLKEEDDVDKLDEQEPVQGISFGDILFRYTEPFKTFFMNLLSPEYRVTVDVYAFMFFCDFINFLIVVFGYWAFGTGGTDGGVASYFEENKVPIPFLIMLIAQFALIVIDRALYLRKYILGKLFFQIVLVFIVHIWMFFILPAVTEREFTSPNTLPPKLWYFIKCVYLLLSAYQIRSGYPTRILGNFFCKKYNYVNFFLFKGYMLIPFLYELRSLMDWIWTDTSMNIGNWLKMEDIFTNIYLLKCIRRVEAEYPTPRGAKRTSLVKYGVGGFLLFIIILIIWFPLLLFALGNTVGLPNAPYDCTVEITIGGYEPIFKMSAQRNSLKSFTQNDWDKMVYYYRSDPSAQTFLANYDIRDVTVVELNGNSTSVWAVSPPSQAALITELLSNETELNVKLSWSFSRDPKSSDVEKTVNNEHVIKLNNFEDRDLREKLAHMLNGSRSTDEITLPYLFPKYLKVPGRGRPSPVATLVKSNERHLDEEQQLYRDLFLHLRYGSFRNLSAESEWWEIQEDCSGNTYPYPFLSSRDCQYLRLIAFSDKVFPSELSVLSGYGIVGLYTTFVLVVSRLVRGFVAGTSFTIMFDDMPYVDRVLQLCLDIYLVRESGEFTLEEDLFAKLIFLYRSPETLITWTQYPPDDPGTN